MTTPSGALACCWLAVAASALADCEPGRPLVTNLGIRDGGSEAFAPGTSPLSVERAGAAYLRVRLRWTGPRSGCDWRLTVRDAQFHAIQTLSPRDFGNATEVWTTRVRGSRMFLLLQADEASCAGTRFPALAYDQVLSMNAQATSPYYSLQTPGQPAYRPLYDASVENHLRTLGDHVGFLMMSYGASTWACSGVLVGRDLFMTNWHCGASGGAWTDEVAQNAIIDLSWDDNDQRTEFQGVRTVAQYEDLDFAILEIRPITGSGVARSAPIRLGTPPSKVILVHHPAGIRKQVSLRCPVVSTEHRSWQRHTAGTDFTNRCDSEPGSSGAPVFNDSGEIVGLHHLGFELVNGQCDKLNKAVRVDRIVGFLRAHPNDFPKLDLSKLTIREGP